MIGLVHALLIQRTLHCLVKETLIHVSVVRAECGCEDLVANIESIDDTNCIWTDRGEHLFEARLKRRDVFVIQTGKL